MLPRPVRLPLAAFAAVVAAALAGCADEDSGRVAVPRAPPPVSTEFPEPRGRSLAELRKGLATGLELAPGTAVHEPGPSRFGFALFDRARRQVSGAPAALYLSRDGKVDGPFPTRSDSLTVRPQFQSRSVSTDPDAALSLYVAELAVARPGEHEVMAVAQLDDRLVATEPIRLIVTRDSPVPEVGEAAPRVSTPTVASTAGAIDLLETRDPPDTMHEVDFADVVGRRPVLLLFGTPALCKSRVCGPVVDLAEQAKADHEGDTAFIHMEIYEQNRVEGGLRPQVRKWNLPTEPWAFAIDREGKVAARLEGAFSARELREALNKATE